MINGERYMAGSQGGGSASGVVYWYQSWNALYPFYVFHVIAYRQRKRAFQRLVNRRPFKRSHLPIKAYSFPASLDRFICSKLERNADSVTQWVNTLKTDELLLL